MKKCPRCGQIIDVYANYCQNCGWDFNGRRKKRWWHIKKFENVSFEEIRQWLYENNGHIEILDIKGYLRYFTEGIFFTSEEWELQYLNIKYYDDEKAAGNYDIVWSSAYDFLFWSGIARAEGFVDRNIGGYKLIKKIKRSAHYQGGGYSRTACCMALIEFKKMDILLSKK